MKNKVIFFAAICAFVASIEAFGWKKLPEPPSNYVVIGAFAVQNHAAQHVETAKKLNLHAISVMNPKRNLFYVYVLKTDDIKMAFTEAGKLRKNTPFWDTWVFTGVLGIAATGNEAGADVNPVTEKAIASVEVKDVPAPDQSVAKDTVSQVKEVAVAEKITPPAEEGSRNFLFKIFSSEGEVEGSIDIIDVEKTKKAATYAGNQPVVVRPMNKSGTIALVCEVFGYRKLQKDLNFNQPEETGGTVIENDQVTVPFELVRLQKGDFGVMYHVYFFKDAAIMRPESRYEVNNLLKMMRDNMKYKIRLHGHTNGNSAGKVISMGEGKNFFSLNNSKNGIGSAKKLSLERAEVIRDFLVSEGIDSKRMEIKAWGGKHPLYDKMSPQAQANVRVEIEILEDK